MNQSQQLDYKLDYINLDYINNSQHQGQDTLRRGLANYIWRVDAGADSFVSVWRIIKKQLIKI